MIFTRNIKAGVSGDDCKHIKQLLLEMGYYSPEVTCITSGTYDAAMRDAVLAYQAQHRDCNGRPLDADGVVGTLTWAAIARDYEAFRLDDYVKWSRDISYGASGEDVRAVKDRLHGLGYLSVVPTHSRFGSDTGKAVRLFQRASELPTTGVVDLQTWDALMAAQDAPTAALLSPETYAHISSAALASINREYVSASADRRKIVETALRYAYDHDAGVRKYPISLYLWGANLYDNEGCLRIASRANIVNGAKNRPDLFNGGRKEMMLEAIAQDPYISCSDCSGGIVGMMRLHGYVAARFDCTANGLCSASYSTAVGIEQLLPGDWVGYSGHIGLYIGGGYVVEWAGGAYGCQLTRLTGRTLYSFTKNRLYAGKKWTRFRRPLTSLYA